MKHLDKSLLASQDLKELEHLLKQKETLSLDFDQLTKPSEAAVRAFKFDSAFKDHMLNKKDLKTYQTEIRKWITDNPTEFSSVAKFNSLKLQLNNLNKYILGYTEGYLNEINGLAMFISKIGYLTDGWSQATELTKADLTVKGVMAMAVNECNPLMLTELVYGNYLDELTFPDIVSVLALFLDVSSEERDVNWQGNAAAPVITRYLRDMDSLEVEESRLSHTISDWKTNEYLCDLARLWVTEHEIGLPPMLERLGIYDIQPGEFVRMMLKLDNICKEVSALATICGKDSLLKKLDSHHRYIIRNIVTPQSLYVSMN
jgi:superfamily II RNA helicase